MTRVKICGITNLADAASACEAGADAVGLNFYPRSPRNISVARAAEIRAQLPAGVEAFGVFVNSGPEEILEVCRAVGLDAVQLHGDEPPDVVARLARVAPVFKALRVGPDFSAAVLEKYHDASGFLFDAADPPPGQYGGTGRLADWGVAQQAARGHRIILAGGLNAENVAAAILQVRPYGVDVASGVESKPGAKDHVQLREFIREARRADQQLNAPVEKLRAT
ncbi:MAG TPA: phosphoribosylanthranilate isomerase [Candidatus Acidoferrum sp.]|jgi:phosphoribosylanthranilate isomerase